MFKNKIASNNHHCIKQGLFNCFKMFKTYRNIITSAVHG